MVRTTPLLFSVKDKSEKQTSWSDSWWSSLFMVILTTADLEDWIGSSNVPTLNPCILYSYYYKMYEEQVVTVQMEIVWWELIHK